MAASGRHCNAAHEPRCVGLVSPRRALYSCHLAAGSRRRLGHLSFLSLLGALAFCEGGGGAKAIRSARERKRGRERERERGGLKARINRRETKTFSARPTISPAWSSQPVPLMIECTTPVPPKASPTSPNDSILHKFSPGDEDARERGEGERVWRGGCAGGHFAPSVGWHHGGGGGGQ